MIMKTQALEFIYQENEIHFLVNPLDNEVMVNATEMAKIFARRTKDFLKTKETKSFLQVAERALNGAQLTLDKGQNGIYFHRILALKFAAWLHPEFEFWVYSTIDQIVFGNYKKHWDAHAEQEAAKTKMAELKQKLLLNPTAELVQEYFEQERSMLNAKAEKMRAIKNQLSIFDDLKKSPN